MPYCYSNSQQNVSKNAIMELVNKLFALKRGVENGSNYKLRHGH